MVEKSSKNLICGIIFLTKTSLNSMGVHMEILSPLQIQVSTDNDCVIALLFTDNNHILTIAATHKFHLTNRKHSKCLQHMKT